MTFALLLAALIFCPSFKAMAGISYQLDTPQANAGDTIAIQGVLFNDSDSVLSWTPPQTLVLQWRNQAGAQIQTQATLAAAADPIELPVNTFATLAWTTTVPAHAKGLQVISIDGENILLALQAASPTTASDPANTAAAQAQKDDDYPAKPLPTLAQSGDAQSGQLSKAGLGTQNTNSHLEPKPKPSTATAQSQPSNGTNNVRLASSSAFERFRNALSTFEPIYFDIGRRNGTDARFQLSFKYRLHTPPDPQNTGFFDHWYLGYTQTSLWDLSGASKPFIDTTYNPSLFWQKDRLWGPESRAYYTGLAAGLEHKSNGKAGPDSRSLNSFFIEPQFNYRFADGSTLSAATRFKNYFATKDNPDYARYMGHIDWKLRWAQDNGLVLDALYNHGQKGRYRVQLQAAWPLQRTFLKMNGYLHLQYFRGYGETLLGYREKSPGSLRIGLALVP